MSYEVSEGIKDALDVAKDLGAIQEFDREVYKRNGRWVSHKLGARDCTEIEVDNSDAGPIIRYYMVFGETRLYPASFGASDYLSSVFKALRTKDPEKFRKLVETFRSGEFQFE